MANLEIERKFLINEIPFDLSIYEKSEIIQAYISTDPTIRLRKDCGKDAESFILTVKGKGNLSREEFELVLTWEQFEKLWRKAETKTISKMRYKIPLIEGLTAELDIYSGELSPLITVEVEFLTLESANDFTPPAWFGKEITLDNRYKNSGLAQYGLPQNCE